MTRRPALSMVVRMPIRYHAPTKLLSGVTEWDNADGGDRSNSETGLAGRAGALFAPCGAVGIARRSRLKVILVLGLVCLPALTAVAIEPPEADRAHSLVQLANQQRVRAGLPALRANPRLMRAAQTHAEQTAALRKLAHVLPNARHPRPEDRLKASGYDWSAFGENLAVGQRSTSEATAEWMKSPGHRNNLLSPKYTELGTGYATDDTGKAYYVQVFGRPM
jgi:uncharacterized protein YkwD